MLPVLRPVADLRTRVWGGTRLAVAGADPAGPIGEAWVAGPTSRVPRERGLLTDAAAPTPDGPTLDELAARLGRALVGSRSPWPDRFPLLVKLLDPAEWLSVQVHPDDDLAVRLAGPNAVGKTEAWYVLDAEPGATLLVGVRPGVAAEEVRTAIRGGGLASLLEPVAAAPGDTILVPAGTFHAVGPGLFLYELQQPSDLTYRADDWGRPATPERPLHVAEALAAFDPLVAPILTRAVGRPPSARAPLVECPHFVMERIDAGVEIVDLDPAGATPHVVTALPGARVGLDGPGWREVLEPLETAVVPATGGAYRVSAAGSGPGMALLAHLRD